MRRGFRANKGVRQKNERKGEGRGVLREEGSRILPKLYIKYRRRHTLSLVVVRLRQNIVVGVSSYPPPPTEQESMSSKYRINNDRQCMTYDPGYLPIRAAGGPAAAVAASQTRHRNSAGGACRLLPVGPGPRPGWETNRSRVYLLELKIDPMNTAGFTRPRVREYDRIIGVMTRCWIVVMKSLEKCGSRRRVSQTYRDLFL